MAVIALDLGGTKLAAALFAQDGQVISRSTTPLNQRTGREVGQLLCEQVRQFSRIAADSGLGVKATGVCVPGISHEENGTVWAPNIPGWDDYPLRRELEAALKASRAPNLRTPPVRIDSDRACYILGEQWKGAAAGCRNAVFMAVGTGIGAGLLVNGEVLSGAHGTAGSIGWMALQRPFLANYKACGCYEYYASGPGIARAGAKFAGRKSDSQPPTTPEVFASFRKGESPGKEAIAQAVEFWGMAVANLVSLFDPEIIVFGGGVFGPARRLIPGIRREALKWAQPVAMKEVKLAASRLRADAGLYGAARIALGA